MRRRRIQVCWLIPLFFLWTHHTIGTSDAFLIHKQVTPVTTTPTTTTTTTTATTSSPPLLIHNNNNNNNTTLVLQHQVTNTNHRWEHWCANELKSRYRQALSLKCPYLRRRSADFLDHVDYVLRHYVLRHNPSILGPPLAYRCDDDDDNNSSNSINPTKQTGQSLEQLSAALRHDWRTDTHKGYYITGKLNKALYRDDCLFSGPDPDMPIRGLRKYLNAASQLFDPAKSTCELLSLCVIQDDTDDTDNNDNKQKQKAASIVEAKWRMQGRMRLPWRPWIPVITGRTRYHTDVVSGLVCLHEEEWDISVPRAFLLTFWPKLGRVFWKEEEEGDEANHHTTTR